jgi:hypothetical protein
VVVVVVLGSVVVVVVVEEALVFKVKVALEPSGLVRVTVEVSPAAADVVVTRRDTEEVDELTRETEKSGLLLVAVMSVALSSLPVTVSS